MDTRASTLPLDPLATGIDRGQHLVTLSSVEDDALGEELQVIWELEPGATIYEERELPEPDGFDEPEKLDAFLDAVRWGAVSNADSRNVQAPFRSGVDIEDYQLDPVIRAIQMPRVNLLIADDVGLGKTIEAGLVARELILRQRVRRILIVCPSALQIQWQEQLRDKFGLDFRVVNSDLMKQLRRSRGLHVNPWGHFPRLITSIDFLKRERPLRLLRDILPAEGESIYPRRFDLLIVDEAHNIAPSSAGRYAVDSARTAAIRLLAPHFEHKLFLTATPHNGYPESFTALLELLDGQRFAREIPVDRDQLQVVMVRRLKTELPERWDGTPRFPKRSLESIPVDYSPAEKKANADLNRYTELRRERAEDAIERTASEFVLKLLKKRLFSSPAAFLTTLEQHRASIERSKRPASRAGLSRPTPGILARMLEQVEEEFADDEGYEEVTLEAVASTSSLFRPLDPEEADLLDSLLNYAENARRQPDTKAKELLSWLDTHIRPNGKWTEQRVIIFTEYRATQKWLYEILAGRGMAADDRLMTLYGGMNAQERERIKAAFQADPAISPVRILLATDAASEGLDLQNHCSNLIHYEIPWNPNRMEQRNGRIDRHGQKAPSVRIYHFVGKTYSEQATAGVKPGDLDGDLEFLMRAAVKVNTIREDLGKVGPVIAAQVEEAMLGKRSSLDTRPAERESEPIRRLLKFERNIREQIEKLKEHLSETRSNLRITPDNTLAVVRVGLEIAGQPPLIPHDENTYELPPLRGSWADCGRGLAHPHTGENRPIVFDPDLARGRDDVVLVHLDHRLVQMCLRLLRSEIWSRGDRKNLYRVTAKVVPSPILDYPAAIAHGRLVILGGDGQRLHEEVITAGGVLKEGKFERLNVLKVRELLNAAIVAPVPDGIRQRLVERWKTYAPALSKSLETRGDDRAASLQKALIDRRDREIGNITAILTELARSIDRELVESAGPVQLDLFSTTEREQWRRNRDSLQLRLEQIPSEIEEEKAIIETRFANPSTRLFPLAITYLIPAKLTR
jgi:superfamily II DNA or RNA helicase